MNRIAKNKDTVIGAIVIILLALVPLCRASLVEMVTKMVILSVLALSLNMQLGLSGMMPMGHALMFGLSTYGYGICIRLLNLSIWPSVILVIIGILISSLIFGYIMLKNGNPLAYAFLNMGVCLLVYTTLIKIKALGNDMGMTKLPRPDFAPGTTSFYVFALIVCIVITVALYFFYRSPMASILRGVRENELKVEALGVSVLKMRMVIYVLSSFVACLAGLLYAMRNQAAFTNDLSTALSMQLLIMVVLGGANSFWGPILGAFFVTFLTSRLSLYTFYYNGLFGVITVLIVLFMRGGILGSGLMGQIAIRLKGLRKTEKSKEGSTGV